MEINSNNLKIIVCIRQIIDPLTTTAEYAIDTETMKAILPEGRRLVISDYDEVAIEAALKIKESAGGTITVISMGEKSAEDILRHGIAMGADEGILLHDPLFDDSDSFATASALSLAIKRNGEFDLVLCGRQEGDWDAGQVGSGIAELLGIPCVTVAGKIGVGGRNAVVERLVPDGRDVIELPLPALVTVSSEVGEPRYPPVRRLMAARKKELQILNAQDIGYTPLSMNRRMEISVPVYESKCEYMEGSDPVDTAVNLVNRLKQDKLIL